MSAPMGTSTRRGGRARQSLLSKRHPEAESKLPRGLICGRVAEVRIVLFGRIVRRTIRVLQRPDIPVRDREDVRARVPLVALDLALEVEEVEHVDGRLHRAIAVELEAVAELQVDA